MTRRRILLSLALPCLVVSHASVAGQSAASKAAAPAAAAQGTNAGTGVTQFYIAPEQADALKALGLNVSPLATDSLAGREPLLVPGVGAQGGDVARAADNA